MTARLCRAPLASVDATPLHAAFARHGVTQCVVLASTFRSGSSYTASLLAENGVPGLGDERFARIWAADDLSAALDRAIAPFAGGRFPTKLMWPQRNNLARRLGCTRDDAARFAEAFPQARWLYVRRRDFFAQAISFWRAKHSGRWHVYTPQAEPELPYSYAQIDACARELMLHEHLWQDFFARAGVTPHSVVYEDLAANPALLDPFLSAFGRRVTQTRVGLRKQADAHSQRCRDHYLADLCERGD